jgi:hypothetical protein
LYRSQQMISLILGNVAAEFWLVGSSSVSTCLASSHGTLRSVGILRTSGVLTPNHAARWGFVRNWLLLRSAKSTCRSQPEFVRNWLLLRSAKPIIRSSRTQMFRLHWTERNSSIYLNPSFIDRERQTTRDMELDQ